MKGNPNGLAFFFFFFKGKLIKKFKKNKKLILTFTVIITNPALKIHQW